MKVSKIVPNRGINTTTIELSIEKILRYNHVTKNRRPIIFFQLPFVNWFLMETLRCCINIILYVFV